MRHLLHDTLVYPCSVFRYDTQAGACATLGKHTPTFELVKELADMAVRQVAAGFGHSAAVTSEGELYTWGGNRDGCCGHPLDKKFLAKPEVHCTLCEIACRLYSS
jgi:hypothetical protein